MKSILITGGMGYLGGRLIQELKSSGLKKHILVGSRSTSNQFLVKDDINLVYTDWKSQSNLDFICQNMDIVIHLAAMDAKNSIADPVGALEVNGVGTARLIQAAIKSNVKRFIYLSTAHVYGSVLVGNINENTFPKPIHPYATSHKAGEDVVQAAGMSGEIETIIIRLSNCFGAPAHEDVNCWSLLIPDLCRQAVTQRKIVLSSSGVQRRDFIPITDACRAIIHLSEIPKNKLKSYIYNVGGNYAPTILEIAKRIQLRYKILFDFDLEISAQPILTSHTSEIFNYKTDLLFKTGFKFKNTFDSELDRLLIFCFKNFNER